jgi:short-chain dehydrogenases of various substrate specificities
MEKIMKVLITGASSGIGRDLAREFAKLNYDIILVARNIERLQELKKELSNKYKINVVYESVDLTDRKKCIDLYSKYTDIDILINNAGLGDFGNFTNTDINKDLTIIDTNITATHILTKLYLKTMKNRNNGKILNVASIAGFLPGPLMATYYASKNYVVKLSEGIREELKKEKSKVQISILCPGPVKTNFNNVANVKFEISSLSSEFVAEYTVKKFLKNKFYIIPGFQIKCAKFFSKFVPTTILAKCTYYMQKRKDR